MARAWIVAACVALGACSLLRGVDGLSEDGDTPEDLGAEAGPPAPANPDAGVSPADAATPFCSTKRSALFCADFDETADPQADFDDLFFGQAKVTLDETAATSRPASLLFELTSPLAAQPSRAWARRSGLAADAVPSIRLSFSVRVDSLAVGEASVAQLERMGGSSVEIFVSEADATLFEAAKRASGEIDYTRRVPLPRFAAKGSWGRYDLTVDRGKAVPEVTVRLDGEIIKRVDLDGVDWGTGSFEIKLGYVFRNPGATTDAVRFDDVLVEAP